MRKRRRWLWIIVLVLLGGAILAALFEPSGTVRALIAGAVHREPPFPLYWAAARAWKLWKDPH